MFGLADMLTVEVIKDGLAHLKRNPYHLEFILGSFCGPPLGPVVGPEHIKQCIEFITENRIQVAPYYEIDMKRRPSIAVVAQGREEQQFIGDFGDQGSANIAEYNLPPRIYVEFDPLSFTDDMQGMIVTRDLRLDEKLWPGIFLTNGTVTAKMRGMLVRDGYPTTIYLEDKLPEGTSLPGWKAVSSPRGKGVVCSASTDLVTVQMTLTTTGELSVHRLMSVVLRYCLKRGRMTFEKYGMQVPTFSYTPPIVSEQTELEMESTYTIESKFTDLWIDHEFDLNDAGANVLVSATAIPETPSEEEQDVNLD